MNDNSVAGATQVSPTGLDNVTHVIAVASGKGGVGKSTVSANLALALQAGGAKVGLMDADIYGPSQPGMLGAGDKKPQLKETSIVPIDNHGVRFISMGLLLEEDSPVIWRAPMATKMIHQFLGSVEWGQLDYLLVDLPPGTGDVQITLAQQAPLTGAVIVTTPQEAALGVARKGLRMFNQVNVPILGIIENMSGFTCGHCGEMTPIFKEGGGVKMAEEYRVPYLGAIPLDTEIMTAADNGTPVVKEAPESSSSKAFLAAADNLRGSIDSGSGGANAIEPTSVEMSDEGDLMIQWRDGHQGINKPYKLRKHCSCAACIDEDTGQPLLDHARVPLDIRIETYQKVGRYALGIAFSDRHNSGIYTYERLRAICECDKCVELRGDKTESFSV